MLKRLGTWRTALVSENPYVDERYNLAQGFDDWAPVFKTPSSFRTNSLARPLQTYDQIEDKYRLSKYTSMCLFRFLKDGGQSNRFVYVHAMEPHLPYGAPAGFEREFSKDITSDASRKCALYDAGIATFLPVPGAVSCMTFPFRRRRRSTKRPSADPPRSRPSHPASRKAPAGASAATPGNCPCVSRGGDGPSNGPTAHRAA